MTSSLLSQHCRCPYCIVSPLALSQSLQFQFRDLLNSVIMLYLIAIAFCFCCELAMSLFLFAQLCKEELWSFLLESTGACLM